MSGEWQVNEKLKLKGDYTVSYGTVMFAEFNGVFVANPTLSLSEREQIILTSTR